jgi:hypothetical protein
VTAFELSVLPGLPADGDPARAFSIAGAGSQSEGLVVGLQSPQRAELDGKLRSWSDQVRSRLGRAHDTKAHQQPNRSVD